MDWAMSWLSGSSPTKEYRKDTESREIKEEDGWAIVGGASSRELELPPKEEQKKDEDLKEESDGEREKKKEEVAIQTRDTQKKLEPMRPGPYFAAFMNPNTVQYLSQACAQTLATYFGYPGPVIILNTLRGFRAAYNTFCATKAIESKNS